MMVARQIKRSKLRGARKNKIIKFSDMWAERQNKRYGIKRAEAMRKVGKGQKNALTNQVLRKLRKLICKVD